MLSLSGITKRWRKQPAPVLADAALELAPGEVIAIRGRNGAGKTTLLRIAAGMIAPDSGAVSLLGLDPHRDRRQFQRQLGFLSAGDRSMYARLTVRHHLEYAGGLALMRGPERSAAIERAIPDFDLEEFVDQRVDRISTGQRQRVRLAMAFLHDPRVVLLDEPRNSLDVDGLEALSAALARLTAAGGAGVCCFPAGEQQGLRFDRVLELRAGRLDPP